MTAPNSPPPAPDPDGTSRPQKRHGETHVEQDNTVQAQRSAPRQPNEHDASADSQSREQAGAKEVGQKAYGDVHSGRRDTGTGPVVDKVYNEKVRDSPRKGPRP